MSSSNQFTDEFEDLPADAPRDRPHIINLVNYNPSDMYSSTRSNVWDGIVTVLFMISPDTLKEFLDPKVRTFKFVFQPRDEKKHLALVINRNKNEVFVGIYCDVLNSAFEVFEWDQIVRCSIADDGTWKMTHATYRQYSARNINDALAGRFIDGYPWPLQIIARTTESFMSISHFLLQHLLSARLWDPSVYKWNIKTKQGKA